MSESNTTRGQTGDPPLFEEALTDLQKIVRQLEDGELGLEESLREFERGVGLLRNCYRFLEMAEQKMESLTRFDADGQPVLAPFDATATIDDTRQAGRSPEGGEPAANSVEPDLSGPRDADASLF